MEVGSRRRKGEEEEEGEVREVRGVVVAREVGRQVVVGMGGRSSLRTLRSRTSRTGAGSAGTSRIVEAIVPSSRRQPELEVLGSLRGTRARQAVR